MGVRVGVGGGGGGGGARPNTFAFEESVTYECTVKYPKNKKHQKATKSNTYMLDRNNSDRLHIQKGLVNYYIM
jgi:hypothetical protein